MAKTPVDLFAFGSKTKGPRLPRPGIDFFPDDEGMVGPELPPSPNGFSLFADVNACPLTGHYFLLPAGTELDQGLAVIADGNDVNPESVHPSSHYTIFPSVRQPWQGFIHGFSIAPWQYAGKKE